MDFNQLVSSFTQLDIGAAGDILVFIISAIIIVAVALIILNLVRIIIRKNIKRKKHLEQVVLKILLPKYGAAEAKEGVKEQHTQQEIVEKIAVMEAFFANIGGLSSQKGLKYFFVPRDDHFSFEIVLEDELIYFYVVMPHYQAQYFEDQITAQFPRSTVEEVEDYNIFNPKGVIVGKMLKQRRPYIFPIKTYRNLESDSLNAITNSLSEIDKESGAVIQFIVRSARPGWREWAEKTTTKANQGKKLSDAIKAGGGGLLHIINSWASTTFDLIFSTGAKEVPEAVKEKEKEHKLSQQEQEAIKGIEEKAAKSGMDVNIRVLVSSDTKAKANQYLDNILNSFAQFNIYQEGNAFGIVGVKTNKLIRDFIYRNFDGKNQMLLNAEEMTSVFHFPLGHTDTPNIVWLLSKSAPPPANIPKEGLFLGTNVYRGNETPIYMKREDRRRHMYIIGMTGTGKSKWMDSLILQDIKNGEGVCFIDPHGDDVDLVLSAIPKERAEDVIVFDPGDYERPLAMNMLEYDTPEQKTFVVNEILAIFDKLYDLKATGGPMFEQYMRNALILIMDDPESGSTLMEVPKVLADESFRRFKLSKCKTQVVKDFWEKEAQKAGGEAALANMVPYITSKLTPFIANDLLRPIVAQQVSSFNFREAMDSKKIVLVKLAKGKIGDINANLLGMIIIGKILFAALGRGDIPEEERHDYYLYIDEFQNFLTESINTILSEARKYRLNLTVAHQFMGQLEEGGDDTIKKAIFGNVGTKCAFRIGVDDAPELAKEFAPVFNEYDLMNGPKFQNFIKLLIDNANPPAFNMKIPYVEDMFEINSKLKDAIVKLSRLKYGRDREIVEAEIQQRSKVSEIKAESGSSIDDLFA